MSRGSIDDPDTSEIRPRNARILYVPAHDQADEVAAAMLAQLLEQQGDVALSFLVGTDFSDTMALVEPGPQDLICISALPPYRFSRLRNLSGRPYVRRSTQRLSDQPFRVDDISILAKPPINDKNQWISEHVERRRLNVREVHFAVPKSDACLEVGGSAITGMHFAAWLAQNLPGSAHEMLPITPQVRELSVTARRAIACSASGEGFKERQGKDNEISNCVDSGCSRRCDCHLASDESPLSKSKGHLCLRAFRFQNQCSFSSVNIAVSFFISKTTAACAVRTGSAIFRGRTSFRPSSRNQMAHGRRWHRLGDIGSAPTPALPAATGCWRISRRIPIAPHVGTTGQFPI